MKTLHIIATTAAVLLSLSLSAFALSPPALPPAQDGEVIDRIVARVNGHIILQSDWDEALCYESLFSGRNPGDFSADERRAVLDRLIDQELLSEQSSSALFRRASEAEIAARVAETRKQYPAAATDNGWQSLLAKFSLTEKDLAAHVQQQIDLMRLVDAHFRPAVQIDSKTIEEYYREKFVPQLKQAGATEIPLAQVTGKIRELLTQEKVTELLGPWLQSLRSESRVIVAAAPAARGEQTR